MTPHRSPQQADLIWSPGRGLRSGRAGLVLALVAGGATVVHMTAVAAVLGACRALFEPAGDAMLGVLFALMALLAPTANTTIVTHQLLLTPDALRGRLSGTLNVAVGTAAAAGPALGESWRRPPPRPPPC